MGAKNTVVSKEEAEVEEEEEVEERLHIVGVRVRFPAKESRERKVTVEVVFVREKKKNCAFDCGFYTTVPCFINVLLGT